MNLTQQDFELIKDIVHDAVAKEVQGICTCHLAPEDRKEAAHFFAQLRELGGGNTYVGINETASSIQLITRIRRHGERVGGALSIALFVAAASSILGIVALGVKAWLVTNGKQQ